VRTTTLQYDEKVRISHDGASIGDRTKVDDVIENQSRGEAIDFDNDLPSEELSSAANTGSNTNRPILPMCSRGSDTKNA
jgi:hypothetical protein